MKLISLFNLETGDPNLDNESWMLIRQGEEIVGCNLQKWQKIELFFSVWKFS